MSQPKQFSFADAEYANKGKVTRREKFLDQLKYIFPSAPFGKVETEQFLR